MMNRKLKTLGTQRERISCGLAQSGHRITIRTIQEMEVDFTARSRERLEDRLAKQLEEDPHTQIIECGLGANDVPGNTHLLHVSAAEA